MLVEAVSRNVETFGIWRDPVEEGSKILVDVTTLGKHNLNIEGRVGLELL
ncbi:MAG: hypothetical protein N3F08_04200 [Crenarchaeota archaeon]|nr:hypothetical protein [Thermoproteota archaeon]